MNDKCARLIFPICLILLFSGHFAAAQEAPVNATGEALDSLRGEEIYRTRCAQCHDQGTHGAPRLSHADDWGPVSAKSFSVFERHALKGFLNMPQKGGYPLLTEQEVASAVLYMQERIGRK